MAVASQYGGDLALRDAQERLSLCHLQTVVQDSRIHALFHPAQPRAGDTRTVEDALNRTVPDRVILVPDFQKQPRIDDGIRDDVLIQPLIRIHLLQFLLHLTAAGDCHKAQVFGSLSLPEGIFPNTFQAVKEILLILEHAAIPVGKYSCFTHSFFHLSFSLRFRRHFLSSRLFGQALMGISGTLTAKLLADAAVASYGCRHP